MSGWFPMDLDLQDKPEFLFIQAELEIDPDLLAGKLLRFWGWFDEQTTDGYMAKVTAKIINARLSLPRFAEAMVSAGWLVLSDDGARVPGFEKRHSQSAKKRLLHSRRQAGYRKDRPESPDESSCAACDPHGMSAQEAREQHASSTEAAPTKQDKTIHTSPNGEERAAAPSPPPGKVKKPLPKPKPADVPIPPELDFPEFRDAWGKWLIARPLVKNNFTALAAEGHLRTLAALPRSDVIPCMEYTFERGYQAFFPDFKGKANHGPQRTFGNVSNRTGPSREYDPGHTVDAESWGLR